MGQLEQMPGAFHIYLPGQFGLLIGQWRYYGRQVDYDILAFNQRLKGSWLGQVGCYGFYPLVKMLEYLPCLLVVKVGGRHLILRVLA